MGKAFTKEEKIEITEKLLYCGEKIFYKKGLKKTSIKNLTDVTGISLGSFYNFFESKEMLFLKIIDRYNSQTFEVQKDILKKQIENKKLDIEEIINSTFDNYKRMPLYLMLFEKNDEYDYLLSKIPQDIVNQNISKDKEILNYIFDELEKNFVLASNIDRDIIAGILQYMFIGLVNKNIIGNHVVDAVLKANAKIISNYVLTGKI